MRAAQYVRMSTEAQEYSIAFQMAANEAYAAAHHLSIVKTYADPAKSGLDIKRRPGLQSLISDVLSGGADFTAILVYDISRWGRFQDSDEAACYEFLCKRAGIKVHYCAEAFPNDETLASNFLKMVKRTMAAEYLRELSTRVQAGQFRGASLGFKQGGFAGYGLRRLLLDPSGKPKAILGFGDRKSLHTDRVTYTLGPPDEVAVVRQIYGLFLGGMSVRGTAEFLNTRAIARPFCKGPWTFSIVHQILTNPKYMGCLRWNHRYMRLGAKVRVNPPDQWVVKPNLFPAVVSKEVFERVQERISKLRRSDEQLLADLRTFVDTRGHVSCAKFSASGLAAPNTYCRRFGSLLAAYRLIGYECPNFTVLSIENRLRIRDWSNEALSRLQQELHHRDIRADVNRCFLKARGLGSFLFRPARFVTPTRGKPYWRVFTKRGWSRYPAVVMRLQPRNVAVKDFLLLPSQPQRKCSYPIRENLPPTAIACQNVSRVADALISSFGGRGRG